MKKSHGPLLVRVFNWIQRGMRRPDPKPVSKDKRRAKARGEENGETGVARAASALGATFSILVSGALVILVLALLYGFVQEFRRNIVIVDPISIPPLLAQRGFTSTVVAQRLVDQVNALRHETSAFQGVPGIVGREEQVDIALLGNAMSMRSIVRYVRDALGRPEAHIMGEVIVWQDSAVLDLRDGRDRLSTAPVAIGSNEGLDRLIQLGSENLLQLTNPSELFHYFYWKDQMRGEWRRASAVLDFLRDHRNGESSSRYWLFRGTQAQVRLMHADAIAAFDRANAIQPSPAIYIRKAASLVDMGNDTEALATLTLGIGLSGISANQWQMASQVYQSLHRYEEALRAAEHCMTMDSANPYGFVQAAYSLIGLHRYDAAIQVLQRARPQSPLEQFEVDVVLAQAKARVGEVDEALRQSRILLEKDPANVQALYSRAEALFAAGRAAEAAEYYAAVGAKFPNADAFCSEARARIAAGERQKGESLILAGKQLQRWEVLCWLAAGEQYLKAGRDDLAEAELREAVRLDPNDPIVFRRWADSLTALGRLPEAREKQALASAAEKRNRDWKLAP